MAADDGRVRMWDVASGAQLAVRSAIEGVLNSAQFSPSGRWTAIGSDDYAVELLRTADWRSGRKLPHDDEVITTAFSGDDAFLASASADGAVKVWQVGSGKEVASLRAGDDYLIGWTIDISGDGSRVIAAEDTGFTRSYVCTRCLPLEAILAKARSTVGRTLTDGERATYLHDD
jgi:WD40 repeat protein